MAYQLNNKVFAIYFFLMGVEHRQQFKKLFANFRTSGPRERFIEQAY